MRLSTDSLSSAGLGALLSTVLAASTAAQTLDVGVVPDPNAGLATYDFRFSGPPNGQAWVGASLRTTPFPVPVPPISGALMIDPSMGGLAGLWPIGPTGSGTGSFQVPLAIANGLPLMSQAIVATPRLSAFGFTDYGMALWFESPRDAAGTFIAGYRHRLRALDVDFSAGPAGANVMILVNGGQKAQGFLILDGNGQGRLLLQIAGGLVHGDRITILVNNQVLESWRH